ncbi:MAG: JAB domain-containing protein [Candidatus Hydrogenedentes bacterium]|nr:JAB domain-containing protein [Candidatus Hydrogenedentota bacterium]
MNQPSKPYTIPVYKLQLVQEGTCEVTHLSDPERVAEYLKDVAVSDREQMVCLHLNTKNRPIGRQTVSIGTLNATLVHPREVFKAALIADGSGASNIILTHNHPSGDTTPSREDDEITRKIARAGALLGVPLLDHVIVAPGGGFFSYRNSRPDCLKGGD